MASSRTRSRQATLLALYEMDVGGHDPSMALERLIGEQRLSDEQAAFARLLLSGVLEHRARIDGIIEAATPSRPLMEQAAVDRNILRVAVREFLVDNLTPVGAAINEAVELAKKYGSESSPRFINGVLGAVSAPAKAVVQEGK
jgi:transcription antitermination protein NusB